MKADISTLHKPDILTLQRHFPTPILTPSPSPVTLSSTPENLVPDTPLQAVPQEAPAPDVPTVGEVLEDVAKTTVLKVQDYSKLSFRSVKNLASGPRYLQDTLDQMDIIGVGSLPIVLLSGFFIGA